MLARSSRGAGRVGVGIDVGGTKILAGAIGESGALLAEARVASPGGIDDLLPAISAALSQLLGELAHDRGFVTGLGLALPGLVDREGGLHAAPNLAAPDQVLDAARELGVPLASLLSSAGHPDVALAFENDATAAALAEQRSGAAAGVRDAVVISLGTGIGAGFVMDGQLVRGARGFAGEMGHMTVERDGEPCPCGRRGCWERYASGSGLVMLARRALVSGRSSALAEAGTTTLTGEDVTSAARAGDSLALDVLDQFSSWLALGLSSVVELLDPERLVLGGGLVRDADLFLESTRAAFVAACRPAQRRSGDDVVVATLGEYAACIGSGLLGLDSVGGRRRRH